MHLVKLYNKTGTSVARYACFLNFFFQCFLKISQSPKHDRPRNRLRNGFTPLNPLVFACDTPTARVIRISRDTRGLHGLARRQLTGVDLNLPTPHASAAGTFDFHNVTVRIGREHAGTGRPRNRSTCRRSSRFSSSKERIRAMPARLMPSS